MNKYANTILAILVAIILIILFVLVNLYVSKYLFKVKYSDIAMKSEASNLKNVYDDIPDWIKALASKDIYDFSYPDNELFINLDSIDEKKIKRLNIYDLDDYKLFCFNQILEQNNLEFSYKKYGDKISIEILNKKILPKIIKELNNYNIKYKFD